MCKYCNDENKGTQVYLAEVTKSVFGETSAELETKMYVSGGAGEKNEIISTLFIGETLVMENREKIRYCPMCGGKLSDD